MALDLVGRWNAECFDGRLSGAVLDFLKGVEDERPEVREFVDRAFRLMKLARFRAEDVSPALGWALGSMLPRILPGAWGGMVPPITVAGRHVRIDDYVAAASRRPSASYLDLGCGFPPLTTVDTAERFPNFQVLGADPSFGRYLVYDAAGDYACFADDGSPRYFQAGAQDLARLDALHRDHVATRRHFAGLLEALRPALPEHDDGAFSSAERDGCRLDRNPIRQFERPNLGFRQGGLLSLEAAPESFDVARCFNVLVYYDRAFREKALNWVGRLIREGGLLLTGMNWARSTLSRYRVYRKEGGRLVPKEFALSIDNLRPLGLVQVFALHDDDEEAPALARVIGALRADESFRADYDAAIDRLFEQHGLVTRQADGYIGDPNPDLPPAERERAAEAIERALDEAGFVDRAAELLRDLGLRAWRNPVGHLAIDPAVLGGEP